MAKIAVVNIKIIGLRVLRIDLGFGAATGVVQYDSDIISERLDCMLGLSFKLRS